ncbi:hypothetical protein [Stenotrophomonas sepilia]
MSNDKTTLADVQPGGRVRLWDQAERAQFEAWAHAQSYRGGNIMADRDAVHPDVYADPIAQLTWKSWKAALSAQPSPSGQDALHEAVGRIFGCDGSPWRTRDVAAVLRDYAALAARQPVGQIDEAAVLRRAATVLYMWEDDPNLTGYMGDFKDACGILELLAQHAAPPAQAVDLGQIIEQIAQQWDGCSYDAVGETIDVGQAIRAAGKRLIDSQAVSK